MSDFPPELECLFTVPECVKDSDLRIAVGQLARTMKDDLTTVGASVEVIMEASAALLQYAKHVQASRIAYGYPELGGYSDPGSERAAMSSVNGTLTAYRDAMTRLRGSSRMNPEQVAALKEEAGEKFKRCVQQLMQAAVRTVDPVYGTDLQFWVQSTLFPLMQEEGLIE